MMWEKSNGDFVEADVVEWTEPFWPPKRSRRKQKPVGAQKVVGQITSIDGDFIKLTVLKAVVIENNSIKPLLPHKPGSTITKKQATLRRGNPERLHWSEEDVRTALLV